MEKLFAFVLLFVCCQTQSFAEIKIQLVDSSGMPVEHAVVSLPTKQNHLSQSTESVPTPASELEPAVMDQIDKQFQPHVLLVKTGQAVVFPNSDQVRHHVYSFSNPNDFEIRLYGGDQTAPQTFSHPGVVVLGCNIHDQMVGYLYVQGDEISKVSDAQGLVSFDLDLSEAGDEPLSVSIWHSRLSTNKTERIAETLKLKNEQGDWLLELDLLPELKKTRRTFKPRYF